jgi:guanylate kinase
VFVNPPSWEALERRLRGRATESADAIAARLATAREELAAAGEFDHQVVNDDVDRVVGELRSLLAARVAEPASRGGRATR